MVDLDAYFERIGYAGPREPTLATLRELQLRHPAAIAFESLDALRGGPVALDIRGLQRKLVASRRGGYCFEQNLLFAEVLAGLGFTTTALAARVLWQRPADAPAGARTHMLLAVAVDGDDYLCDVGFGGLTPTAPLALVADREQPTPHETFRLRASGAEQVLEARLGAEWRALYRFDRQPQLTIDIGMMNFYVSTHPDSPFRTNLLAARPLPGRRLGLRNRRFTVQHADGRREERVLANAAEITELLEREFDVAVPDDPRLAAALAELPD